MTTYSTTGGMTLVEQANRTHNGALQTVVNVLSKTNRLNLYMQTEECNDGTSHHIVRRSTEPSGTWRVYDEGVDVGTTTTEPLDEPTAMLDHMFVIDKARYRHAPNKERFLEGELQGEMAALQKQAMTAVFYGNRDSDANFAGKIVRGITYRSDYNTLSSDYVYDNAGGNASATANKTSIYLFASGSKKVHFIYPRGDAPGGTVPTSDTQPTDADALGIKIERLKSDVAEGNSLPYPAINIWFEHHFGIAIEDPRYVRRVCNISTTNVDQVDDFSFNPNYLIDALTEMPDYENAFLACNRQILAQIWKLVKDSSQRMFSETKDAFGEPVPTVFGLPLVLCDAISSEEATVS